MKEKSFITLTTGEHFTWVGIGIYHKLDTGKNDLVYCKYLKITDLKSFILLALAEISHEGSRVSHKTSL
jgi:hypothetical protein